MIGFYLFIGSVCLVFSAEKKAQLIFSEMSVNPGQKFEIPVLLNNVPNMAGIKLAIKFDKDLLTYVKSEKTKTTASLMHIVNDKHPGKLVIVMAGARGVSVNNQPIMNLFFSVNNNIPKQVDTKFKVTELQLMSDSLKELAYELNVHPIHIKASKNMNLKTDLTDESKNQKQNSRNTIDKPESKEDTKKTSDSTQSKDDQKNSVPGSETTRQHAKESKPEK